MLSQEAIDEITLEVEKEVYASVPPEAADICNVYVEAQVPQIVQAIFDDIKETDICARGVEASFSKRTGNKTLEFGRVSHSNDLTRYKMESFYFYLI
jgi:hypothetical protein